MQLSSCSTTEQVPSRSKVGFDHDDEVLKRCGDAKRSIEHCDYQAARTSLASWWERVGERPRVAGLGARAQAELLLCAGSLCGGIGSAEQIAGAQEFAKDLISDNPPLFQTFHLGERVAEAPIELALCHY